MIGTVRHLVVVGTVLPQVADRVPLQVEEEVGPLQVAQEVLEVPQAVVINGMHQILEDTSLVIIQPLRVSMHICSRII